MGVERTSFGSITINGRIYTHDVWVLAEGEIKKRDRDHEFTIDELFELLEGKPEVIVIGTGQAGCVSVEDGVVEEAQKQGIELEIAETPEAITRYNLAVKTGKRVAAAFHVTC